MVYVGASILAASLVILVYKYPPSKWRALRASEEKRRSEDVRAQENLHANSTVTENSIDNESIDKPAEISGRTNGKGKSWPHSRPDVTIEEPVQSGEDIPQRRAAPPAVVMPSANDASEPPGSPTTPKAQNLMGPPPLPQIQAPLLSRSVTATYTPPKGRTPSSGLQPPPSVSRSAVRPLPKLSSPVEPPPSAAAGLRAPPTSNRGLTNAATLPPRAPRGTWSSLPAARRSTGRC